jgi:hypothetical protein
MRRDQRKAGGLDCGKQSEPQRKAQLSKGNENFNAKRFNEEGGVGGCSSKVASFYKRI